MATSENGISYFGAGGHNHDGNNSTLINTASYSLFDFKPGYSGSQKRIAIQMDNQTALEEWLIRTISEKVLRPAGLDLAPDTLSGKVIRANTVTATQLQANTITADEIAAGAITASELAANIVLVNNVISSNNYVANTSGWKISSNGFAEFDEVTIRGNVVSSNGNIGGWVINSANITSSTGNTILNSNGYIQVNDGKFTGQIEANNGNVGSWDINTTNITSASGNTILYSNGYIQASAGKFTGQIESTSGNIAGWKIDSNSIYSGTKGTDGSFTGTGNITLATTFISSNQFTIAANGVATFKGTLSAPSGNIGGWTISTNSINSSNTYLYSNGYILANAGKFTGQIESTSGNIGGWSISSNTINANANISYGVFQSATSNVTLRSNGTIFSEYIYTDTFNSSTTLTGISINETNIVGSGYDSAGLVVYGNSSGVNRYTTIQPTILRVGANSTGVGGLTIVSSGSGSQNLSFGGSMTLYASNVTVGSTVIDANVSIGNGQTVRATTSFRTTGSSTTARMTTGDVAGFDLLARPTSLRELKENIKDIDDGLAILLDLRPRIYNFKVDAFSPVDPNTNEPWTDEARELAQLDIKYGFIVDEVLDKRPELVSYSHETTNEDPYGPGGYFDMNSWKPTMWEDVDVIVLSVKAIQQLNSKIEALEARIQELEGL